MSQFEKPSIGGAILMFAGWQFEGMGTTYRKTSAICHQENRKRAFSCAKDDGDSLNTSLRLLWKRVP